MPQSTFTGCRSGQQGISSALCMPGMALAIAFIVIEPEDAMALLANPMLIGPMATASRGISKIRQWATLRNFIGEDWHAVC
ncbi:MULTISPECIES: hypothetical protein [unclassified Rhizobium]|uniref:hypothetical protein n=1 Tax=unclassified Rhizobium TaxID=2613769 RepID=UPI001648D917|nr:MULTISPECIES: hypothetical protein [unclassified Rhizobium]